MRWFKSKPKPVCTHCGTTDCSAAIECHCCGKLISFTGRLFMKQDKCRNCHETQFYHNDCHSRLWNMQPFCHGQYVGHHSGHTIDVHNHRRCALCGLAIEFWSKWYCSPGVVELNKQQLEER